LGFAGPAIGVLWEWRLSPNQTQPDGIHLPLNHQAFTREIHAASFDRNQRSVWRLSRGGNPTEAIARGEKSPKVCELFIQNVEGVAEMGQHIGDLVVTKIVIASNTVTGVTRVKPGGKLVSSGKLLGGLVIEAGGNAVVSGKIDRNVVNDGNFVLNGQVAGRIVGQGIVVMGPGADVSGNDLPIEPGAENSAA